MDSCSRRVDSRVVVPRIFYIPVEFPVGVTAWSVPHRMRQQEDVSVGSCSLVRLGKEESCGCQGLGEGRGYDDR